MERLRSAAKSCEPLRSSFVVQSRTNPGRINDSQRLPTLRNHDGRGSQPSQPFTGVRKQFAAALLPAKRAELTVAPKLLSVREAAEALSVSPATVYSLCKRGEMPHLRVSSAIHIPALVLERARVTTGHHRLRERRW